MGTALFDPQTVAHSRPQPPRHPRLEAYQETSLTHLSAYCYTCKSRAVGAEVLLHLFFGDLACKYCYRSIKTCSDFRDQYPMGGTCSGSRQEHNACRWIVPPCKYVMYNTRINLSMARGAHKLSKTEVFHAATLYLRGVLPLRRMYPWRRALKTIAKAGTGVDLTYLPPRLKRVRGQEGGQGGTGKVKAMIGVTGLMQVERSIVRLNKIDDSAICEFNVLKKDDKKDIFKSNPAGTSINPAGMQNTLPDNRVIAQNTDKKSHKTKKRKIANPADIEKVDTPTPANTNGYPANTCTLSSPRKKIKLKNTPADVDNRLDTPASLQHTLHGSNGQVYPAKLHKKRKKNKLKGISPAEDLNTPANDLYNPAKSHITPANTEDTFQKPKKRKKLKNHTSPAIHTSPAEGLNAPAPPATEITPANQHKKSKKGKLKEILTHTLTTPANAPSYPAKEKKERKKNKLKNIATSTPVSEEINPASTLHTLPDTTTTPVYLNHTLPKLKKRKKSKVTL